MPDSANITSVEALDSFRTSLVLYLSAAKPAVEEVSSELARTRMWLESEQTMYWESQIRRRKQKLDEAEAELFKIRISNLKDATELAQAAVRKGREAVRQAEAKLKVVKHWVREFDRTVLPHLKPLDRLRDVFATDLVNALAELRRISEILASYSGPGQTSSQSTAPRGNEQSSEIS